MEELGQHEVDKKQRQVATISQENFYRNLSEAEKTKAFKGQFNFDHPDAFDHKLFKQTLLDISKGKSVKIPVYDFKTHARKTDEYSMIYPADVILIEGILVFYLQDTRNIFQMKLFVDTDPDTRLSRRVLRDINERGRQLEQVLTQYTKFVKPAFEEFCLPTKKYADVIIPKGVENKVAISLIVQHIKDILNGGLKALNGNGNGSPLIRPPDTTVSSSSSSRPH